MAARQSGKGALVIVSWPVLILDLALIGGLACTAYWFWRKSRQLEQPRLGRRTTAAMQPSLRDHEARLQRAFQMGRLCYWSCEPPDPSGDGMPIRYHYSPSTAEVT